jgi:hypothetical protein
MAWIENGPVALPSRGLVVWAGLTVLAAAVAGVGLGVRASWRDTSHSISGGIDQAQDSQAVIAKPIVELPSPPPPPPAANAAAANTAVAKEEEDTSDIAAKTAAAQAVQSKPSQGNANIDDILTSSSEKPQAPAKPTTDEDAPGGPAKGDVPF